MSSDQFSSWALRILCVGVLCLTNSASLASNEDGDGIIEPGEDETAELARSAQNPIADLISLPLQNNTSYGAGPRERTANVLNIQPVLPFSITEDWNLITRTILPIVSQPSFARGQDRQNGIGDTLFTAFASPAQPVWGKILVGVGPVVNIPTASDDRLGPDAWGMGISGVALTIMGPFVTGALVSQLWNLEGDDFSVFTTQPFLNYNLPGGWYLTSSPIITADFEQDDNAWLVPVGAGVGKIVRLGKLPLNVSVSAYYNAEKPKFGADWSTRFQVQMLFPK
jgi:hypothetical protein